MRGKLLIWTVTCVLALSAFASAQDAGEGASGESSAQPGIAKAAATPGEKIEIIGTGEEVPLTVKEPIKSVVCDPANVCRVTWAENGREIRIKPLNTGDAIVTIRFQTGEPQTYPVVILPLAAEVTKLLDEETCLPTPTCKSEMKGNHVFVRGQLQSIYELDDVEDFFDRYTGSNFPKITVLQAGLTEEAVDQLAQLLVGSIYERAGSTFAGVTPKATSAEWGKKLVVFARNVTDSEKTVITTVGNEYKKQYHAPVDLVFLGTRDKDAQPPSWQELENAAGYLQSVINLDQVKINARRTGYIWVEGDVFASDEAEAVKKLTKECCGQWCTVKLNVNSEQVRYALEKALGDTGFKDITVEVNQDKLYLMGKVERASQKEKIAELARRFVYSDKYLRYQIAVQNIDE